MKLKQILYLHRKKEAAELVYDSEISAVNAGLSINEVLKMVNESVKNPLIEDAIKQIIKGKSRSVAYKDILPNDVITLLKAAEQKQITAGDMFKNYVKLKQFVGKSESRMQSALVEPTFSYLVITAIAYFTVNQFYTSFSTMYARQMSTVALIKTYYFLITLLPVIAMHTVLKAYPDKVPLWNKIYRYVISANFLLAAKTIIDLGMSSADVIAFLKKAGNKTLMRRISMLRAAERDMSGLTKALGDYLSTLESALLRTAARVSEEKRVLSSIAEKRLADIEGVTERLTGTFSKILTALAVIPIGLIVYTFLTVMTVLTSPR